MEEKSSFREAAGALNRTIIDFAANQNAVQLWRFK
jgi:hypothetical protein